MEQKANYPPILIILIAIVGVCGFGINLLYYILEEYYPFIYHYTPGYKTYLPALLRFTCRVGYVVSFIGLFFMKRWAIYLCGGVWLSQLVPSSIYFIYKGQNIAGHLPSLIQLLIYLVVTLAYFKKFQAGGTAKALAIFFPAVISVHTILFVLIQNSVI
jgi:hypothetical protein